MNSFFLLSCSISTKSSWFSAENITAFTTIVLAIITGFYSYWTYKLVKINKEEAELINRPYIFVSTMSPITEGGVINYRITLENSGKIPATTKAEVFYKNNNNELDAYNTLYDTIQLTPNAVISRNLLTTYDHPNSHFSIEFILTYKPIHNKNKEYKTHYVYEYKNTGSKPIMTIISCDYT